jgi:2-keto-3-deoxy-6-phosphogluconate aldolase
MENNSECFINEENMADYLAAGVCGFGVGSNIADKKLISSNSFDKITALAEKYVSALRRV